MVLLIISLIFISAVQAASNPISVQSAVLLGNQTSGNDDGTYRDGGWEGQIGTTFFQLYADTQNCDVNDAATNCQGLTFRPNTIALSTPDPEIVTDYVTPFPATFCDPNTPGYRIHPTNIVSLSSTTGVVWYSNISTDNTVDINGASVGSGVATISWSGSGSPTCTVFEWVRNCFPGRMYVLMKS
jgi:hypothetical protein